MGSSDLDPFELEEALLNARESGAINRVEAIEELIRETDIWLDGKPMPEINAKRLRARMLDPEALIGYWETHLPGARIPSGERRWLIPGLWPWGTTPLLTGQPKAGKSALVAELVASLAIPGRRFLGHFGPAEFSAEERSAGITLISAEGAPEDSERELLRLGVSGEPPDVSQALVRHFHLEAEQLSFDITDSKVYDEPHWD